MKGSQVLLLTALLCLLSQSLCLSLPGILSSFVRGADAEGELEDLSEDEGEGKQEQDGKYPTTTTPRPTRPPLFPQIPHPADTPLNPLNNPNHPLHPSNLPTLPPLPQLPALPTFPHRETVYATKTIFMEVTDRLTIHPVCMTTYKVTPPCLPYDPHHHAALKEQEEELKKLEIQAQAASVIKPTAVLELQDQVTRVLSKPSDTYYEADSIIPVEETVDETPASREARYIELTPSIPSAPEKVEIKDAPVEPPTPAPSGGSPLDIVHNLLHNPVTHYKTKTLLVTKVEKILDTRVTATLVPKNCIPTNSHIPLCAPHGGLVGPGYHGYHGYGDGIYTESYGGHIAAGQVHTEPLHGGGYYSGADVVEHVREQQAKESDNETK